MNCSTTCSNLDRQTAAIAQFRQHILQQDTSAAAEQNRRLLLTHEIRPHAANCCIRAGSTPSARCSSNRTGTPAATGRAAELEAEKAEREAENSVKLKPAVWPKKNAPPVEAAEKLAQQRAEQLRLAPGNRNQSPGKERLAKAQKPASSKASNSKNTAKKCRYPAAEQDYYLQQLQWQLQRQLEAESSYPAWAKAICAGRSW